jgi:hypothetical protein
MKIIIFNDPGTFQGHPLFKEATEPAVMVLDFITHSYSSTLSSPEDKKRLIDQYVEEISDIGDLNHYSLPWLCHPISEKNDLVPHNLFTQVKDFLDFHRAVSKFNGETLAVLADSPVLVKSIMDFSKQHSIPCELLGLPAPALERNFSTGLRWLLSGMRRQYRFLKEKRSRARKQRFLPNRLDKEKTCTVIRTWFDYRSPSLIDRDRDIYYGQLPGFLKKKGREILFFGDITGSGFGRDFEAPAEGLRHPVLLDGALLKISDVLKGARFHLRCKKDIRLKDKIAILDVDVGTVFKNYLLRELRNPAIASNYFTYLAAKRLAKKVKADRFINLFENYSWEKVTTLALREHSKNIKITAFQHAQVAPGSIKFFLGKKEARGIPLPDRIVTPGRVTRDFLVKEKNYPPDITVPGCALRHDYQFTREQAPRGHGNRLLLYLWTFERSVEMLNFLFACATLRDRFPITVSTHPNHPMEKLKPHLNFINTDTGIFKVSTDSLENNFQKADIVIYSGTTVCLDALANGLPVINIEFDDFITPDPLFDFTEFKWNAGNEQELLTAIDTIRGLSDAEYHERQKKALDFVRNYFYPVNETNMEVFLMG